MSILCFGSLNIDYVYKVNHFVGKGETLSSEELNVFAGGKGLNQAIALSRAGADVYMAGAIGEDGSFLLQILQDAEVNTEYVKVLNQIRTGNAIIQNDLQGDNCILLYGGANQSITTEQMDQVLKNFGKNDWILLQNEINDLDYLVEKAHEAGIKIVLNPSPMNEKLKKVRLDYIDCFILNEIEAMQLIEKENGHEAEDYDLEVIEKQLTELFPDAKIVLTLGEKGSVYLEKDRKINQPVYPVKAVDTTAAGDTFTGYFLSEMVEGKTTKEALEMAAKASAIAVTRKGAAPSIPKMEEVSEESK